MSDTDPRLPVIARDQDPDAAAGATSPEAAARMERLARLPMESAGATAGWFAGTVASIKEILDYRELLDLLVRRELKAKYKDSALGFLWTLIRPLVMLLVYYVVIGKFLGAARQIDDFAIYLFTGLTIWQLFSDCVGGGTGAILSNAGLVKKVYLPREVFPLSVVGSALFTFATFMVILLGACIVVGRFPTGERLLFAPLAVAVVLVWGTALGMLLGALNVYLRDVQYLVEVVLTVMFWATPVIYAWHHVQSVLGPLGQSLYISNPPTAAVLGFQRAIWVAGSDAPVPAGLGVRLVIMLLIGFVLLWVCQRIFARLQSNFAQEL